MKDILRTTNLVKSFKDGRSIKKVLNETNLNIKEGQFLSIIGESGAGKSTLLYQLSLLDTPTSGNVYVFDKDLTGISIKEQAKFRLKNFGYVFQDSSLIKELSVLDNVKLPLLASGMSKKRAEELSKEALEKFGLEQLFKRYPSEISGGENQRVAISRAIVTKPSIIFADEPTANLDHTTSSKVMNELEKISKNLKITVVMITHELDSIQTKNIKPPSNIGNGIILNKARLTDSNPKKKIKLTNPTEAALAEYSAIFIGPAKDCFTVSEFFDTKTLPIVLKKTFVVLYKNVEE